MMGKHTVKVFTNEAIFCSWLMYRVGRSEEAYSKISILKKYTSRNLQECC